MPWPSSDGRRGPGPHGGTTPIPLLAADGRPDDGHGISREGARRHPRGVGLTDDRRARHDARVSDTDTPANDQPLMGADHRC